MTVSFEGIKVGDRVRLFNSETQDEATLTVTDRGDFNDVWISSKKNAFYNYDWTYVEVLPPLPKPLPIEPGFYQSTTWDEEGLNASLGYHLSTSGQWIIIYSGGSWETCTPERIEGPLVRLVREVTP